MKDKSLPTLRWKAYWTWFGAVALYFNLIALPVMVWCIAHYTDHDIPWLMGFSIKVVAGSIVIATLVGYYMVRYAERKGKHKNVSEQIAAFHDVIEVGQTWRFYLNLFGLVYVLCRKMLLFTGVVIVGACIRKPKHITL